MEVPFTWFRFARQRRLVVLIVFLSIFCVSSGFAEKSNPEKLVPLERVLQENHPPFYRQPGFYFFSLPGIIFFISVILSKRLRAKNVLVAIFFAFPLVLLSSLYEPREEVLRKAYEFYDKGEYDNACQSFVASVDSFPNSKSLKLNTALAFYQAKQLGKAIGYLHRVLKTDPLDYRAFGYLAMWENNFKFFAMKKKIPLINMDILFWFLIVVINVIFVFAGIYYLKHQGIWLILLITSITVFLIIAVVFGITLSQTWEELAVLTVKEGDLKRIPVKEASSWVTLREGTVFKVLGKEQELVLVETDLGLKGWIDESLLEFLH
ncbi:MAG: tetratricopeptide repeat protein [Spirochaetales bacterium]|nr:tetratricopeptide repeat protein [Spirochaetales bacterium]